MPYLKKETDLSKNTFVIKFLKKYEVYIKPHTTNNYKINKR